MDIQIISSKKIEVEKANDILCRFIVQRKESEANRVFLSGNSAPTEEFFQIVSTNLSHFQKHLQESIYGPEKEDKKKLNNGLDSVMDDLNTPIPLEDFPMTPLKDSINNVQIYTDTNNEDGDISEKYSDISSSNKESRKTNGYNQHNNNKESSSSSMDTDNEESEEDNKKKTTPKTKTETQQPQPQNKSKSKSKSSSESESESESDSKNKNKKNGKSNTKNDIVNSKKNNSKKRPIESSSESSSSESESELSSSSSSESESDKKKKKSKKSSSSSSEDSD
ncbi:hypothetical protein DLAC_07051 [Tieghemostelium lacteum]|uniref:Uncharacterized protein n=1 Tax=Tieghemostelium lacteum TaxID=361077 RepID=A0A151ZE49_TIELA|nr:hypothetical protein DLAC_07051 [Tieghemostelium lacteum]|eukprot:KYQ92205.1 hypothetical protein DLAC_07051 [Tieghemostelium lacteum]